MAEPEASSGDKPGHSSAEGNAKRRKMNISTLVLQSVIGISYGMDLFITALGITLIFGVARVVNFAHGSLYAVGAYACFSLTSWMANISWELLAGLTHRASRCGYYRWPCGTLRYSPYL